MDSERSGQTLAFGILMNFTSEYRYLATVRNIHIHERALSYLRITVRTHSMSEITGTRDV
jgi:hypothetical protein